MNRNMAVIFAIAPVFLVAGFQAWTNHLPWVAGLIALGYLGFLVAYARAPRAR